MAWPPFTTNRVGLGCMRLSTEQPRDLGGARATLGAALEAGITVFDTAHAYGLDDSDLGHNERLLGEALRTAKAIARTLVITKGGIRRPSGKWVPDGRATTLRTHCEASLEALGGVPIALYLVHAPDPRVDWATTVRGLRALLDEGLVQAIGLSNVSLAQLDLAMGLAPISAVQQGFSLFDDRALRSGVIARCLERQVTLLAHTPLGGVKRATTLSRQPALKAVAERRRVSPAQVALAALLDLHPRVMVLPGARRPETARDAAAADALRLDDDDRAALKKQYAPASVSAPQPAPTLGDGEVVMLMGLQGAGKTRAVRQFVEQGFTRLNRDEAGGTLAQLAQTLDQTLAAGQRRVVLDNTCVSRESRRSFLEVCSRHRVPVRGEWFEVTTQQAQVNVVLRMLAHHGRLLEPDELKKGQGPESLPPSALFKMARDAEPPTADEGFTAVTAHPFVRQPRCADGDPGRIVALSALERAPGELRPEAAALLGAHTGQPLLVYGWRPDATTELLAPLQRALDAAAGRAVELAVCPHPAGPPSCWCRPPMPGLVLRFALAHRLSLAASTFVGEGPTPRALAAALAGL